MQSLSELRPKLEPHSMHIEGKKLVLEDPGHREQAILGDDKRAILDMLDGNHTIKDIISKLYLAQGSVSFKSTFAVLMRLHAAGLLDAQSGRMLQQMGTASTPHDEQPSPLLRPLFEVPLGAELKLPFTSLPLFYLLSAAIAVALVASPSGVLYELHPTSFLKVQGSYHLAIPALLGICSALLTAKGLVKWVLLSLATGSVYRPSLRLHWFGVSLGSSDNSVYALGRRTPVLAYTLSSALLHLTLASLWIQIFPASPWADSIKVLAVLLTFASLNPYRSSELTKIFTYFYDEDHLGHLLPYLKNRSLFSALDRSTGIRDEFRYVAYSTLALLWGMSLVVFSLGIFGRNLPNLLLAIVGGDLGDKASAGVLLLLLSGVLLGLCYDLFGTLLQNIVYPLLTPLRRAGRSLKAKETRTFDPKALHTVLEKSWFSEDLSPGGLEFLFANSHVIHYGKGTPLIIQGTRGQELFILLKGEVDVMRREQTGLKRTIARLHPNAVFGEISILKDSPRTADVVAVEDVDALVIDKKVLDRLFEQSELKEDHGKMLAKIALTQYLSSSQIFKELPQETISLLRGRGTVEKVAAGQIITKEGNLDKTFYLLLRGAAHASVEGRRVGSLYAGDFFGEIALLANVARTATVQAEEECLMLKLDSETFWEILSENIGFAMYIEAVAELRQDALEPEVAGV